ncbi:carcinoembryonic antigen-related cell adhesion molecule 1 [Colossoma macropomum]|uniref:carcinoembryonic antigen-related cell adhesion molecule 1 n=1 Tax=Colossoma macropomum TaxID=42526 RepID=UPI001864ACDB|nr:carcinoembryonic antigen-related cell adhesion molecule 1 [Colossoma macropomum]
MASAVTEIATSFVIFIYVVQGARSLQIQHEESLNATVGQNISLPCIVSDEENIRINQLEWHREGERGDNKKLVVFNPQFQPYYLENVTLQLVRQTNTVLQGSILHLFGVTEEDKGNYVCEITSFPHGSTKKATKVQVTVPWISAQVESPVGSLVEGDEVKITCASHPPADRYRVLSLQSNFSLESQSGHFTIQNVTRHCNDLICRPLWTSSNQHLQSLTAPVQLTVDFLDSIECNSSSQIQIETGTNLIITCEARSSKPLQYIWNQGNRIVSHQATLSLWLVSPDHSGMYSLIVHARNQSRLQRRRDFVVTVVNRTYAEHQSTTITMETTSQITEGTTLTTAEPGISTMTSQPGYIDTTTPSAGNITTSHASSTAAHASESSTTTSLYTSAEGSTLSAGCCQNETSSPGSTREGSTPVHPETIFKFTLTEENFLTTVKNVHDQSGSKTHAVYVLIPVILLLVLIGFLYRRYLIQKRMDMPPPFKPPPPPVKYTSVRSQNIPVTDILV